VLQQLLQSKIIQNCTKSVEDL